MLYLALILFILAASLGVYLLSYVLSDKDPPKGVAVIHGSFAALGIILLAINAYYYPWFTGLFVVVALGGLYLFITDLSGKKIPKAMALGHGLLAIISFIALALAVFHFY